MNALIDLAQARQAAIAAGTSLYTDDEPFIVVKGDDARLLRTARALVKQLSENNGA